MKIKLVDVSKYKFIVEPRYYYFGWSKSSVVWGRKRAVLALVQARKYLPKGYNFKIWDMQRPRSVQLAMLASFQHRFRSQYPNLSREKIWEMVYKFGAKPLRKVTRLDTHRNGGAVDLTIVDKFGDELFMGTDHDDLTKKAATNYFHHITKPDPLEKMAKQNRNLLIKVMSKAGWKNYPPEWWHWSIDP